MVQLLQEAPQFPVKKEKGTISIILFDYDVIFPYKGNMNTRKRKHFTL